MKGNQRSDLRLKTRAKASRDKTLAKKSRPWMKPAWIGLENSAATGAATARTAEERILASEFCRPRGRVSGAAVTTLEGEAGS
eukprot:4089875-Karenia_brevis.AAC.1